MKEERFLTAEEMTRLRSERGPLFPRAVSMLALLESGVSERRGGGVVILLCCVLLGGASAFIFFNSVEPEADERQYVKL